VSSRRKKAHRVFFVRGHLTKLRYALPFSVSRNTFSRGGSLPHLLKQLAAFLSALRAENGQKQWDGLLLTSAS